MLTNVPPEKVKTSNLTKLKKIKYQTLSKVWFQKQKTEFWSIEKMGHGR